MTRRVAISHPIQLADLGQNNWALEVLVDGHEITPLCMHLSMLRYNLIDSLLLGDTRDAPQVLVSLCKDHRTVTPGTPTCVVLDISDVEAILAFLLTYYRDGMAAVQHIDLELQSASPSSIDYTFVISVDRFSSPLSGAEARRLLGLQ